ncbi:ribosomal L7Ae/L30e/S12e/Gadd45 family protein [uncultured Clostridium sp.]|jgi:large subunit ribosomal protein L7A|uniref:ribosomal L7Ae/L30e/S12e/Gadd45 family protein n=1 Tax=uncultured Clostridium sp. TaxID=59620 RepID=UPI002624D65A|nr:ribosomal L7Ae/L30e/S12e/Gadd45 family protein [uncultured Clostridium sp.]
MVEKLFGIKVIGVKQSLKVIKVNSKVVLYIAVDANEKITDVIKKIAIEKSIDIIYIDTMKKLGLMCGIDVKASAALRLK